MIVTIRGWYLWPRALLGCASRRHAAGRSKPAFSRCRASMSTSPARMRTAAKNQALMDVQVKAFFMLVERLGSRSPPNSPSWNPRRSRPISNRCRSRRKTGSRPLYRQIHRPLSAGQDAEALRGLRRHVVSDQATADPGAAGLEAPEGTKLWEDNPWRKAWLDLSAEQALVPLIVPLGDLEDTETHHGRRCAQWRSDQARSHPPPLWRQTCWWPWPSPPKATASAP